MTKENARKNAKSMLLDNSDELKAIMREGLKDGAKEFLDEKFRLLGQWTFVSVGAVILYGIFYFVMEINGWQLAHAR